jgi:hypothetical protein
MQARLERNNRAGSWEHGDRSWTKLIRHLPIPQIIDRIHRIEGMSSGKIRANQTSDVSNQMSDVRFKCDAGRFRQGARQNRR